MKKIKATVTPDQNQYLTNQTFSDIEPGTLLKDFSSLLDFIGPAGIPISGKKSFDCNQAASATQSTDVTSFRCEAETTPAKILPSHQWLVSFAESIRLNANCS